MPDSFKSSKDSGKKDLKLRVLIFLAAAVCLLIGGSFAKYVTGNMQKAEMLSADFYISGEYIENETAGPLPEFNVSDMNTLSFELYNYEKSNLSHVSKVDIDFKIKTEPPCGIVVTDPNGEQCLPIGVVYTMKMPENGEKGAWNVRLYPGEETSVKVTVETVKPYKFSMGAIFDAKVKPAEFKVEDKGNIRLVTIKTNDYKGVFTVQWDPAFVSPDNTNPIMASWKDTSPIGTFTTQRNHVYRLIFVENTSAERNLKEDKGNSITID